MTGPGRRRGPWKPGAFESAETQGARVVSISKSAARPQTGAGGEDLALGVRPLRGSQVQVASLAPDLRSPEQSVGGERERDRFLQLLDLSVAGASGVACVGDRGTALVGCPVSAGEVRKGFPWSVRFQVLNLQTSHNHLSSRPVASLLGSAQLLEVTAENFCRE